jgi:TolA-binding protein
MSTRRFSPFSLRPVSLSARLLTGTLIAAFIASASPASAQTASIEPRVKKLESEMKAVQRKVFPGSSDRFFEPEISGPAAAPSTTGTSASAPITDLLLRVDTLENQITRLTAQTEENGFKLGQLEKRLALIEDKAAQAAAAAAAVPAPTGTAGAGSGAGLTPTRVTPGGAPTTAGTAAAAPSAERVAAVSAIQKPQTTDAGEDAYLYGYRLWEAKFLPEAQAQLRFALEKHPKHKRTSYTRNLLGRAYLDDGKPSAAAKMFAENYEKEPKGDRAPESLYFLGESLIKLNEKPKACVAFAELAEVYPDVAAGRLSDRLATGRRNAGCK